MSKGFINIKHYSNANVEYYFNHKDILDFKHSTELKDKVEVIEHWKRVEKQEKYGDKTLGIRGRHDARVRTNYTMSMPNSLSSSECIEKVLNIIKQTSILNCVYTLIVFKKVEEQVINQYVILIVNSRDISNNKKDRVIQRKEWLLHYFLPLYQKEFEKEFMEGEERVKRERIHQVLFDSDRNYVRAFVEKLNTE